MRVLWLHGAPAVGKSTVAWRLYTDLAAAGERVAYVDIDQLGMCYPAPLNDPARHRLKGAVLAGLLPNYEAAGAQTLVVSGVVDPAGTDDLTDQLSPASLTLLRLVVDEATLSARARERGWDDGDVAALLAEERALDARPPTGPVVVTDGRPPHEVADEIREHWYHRPERPRQTRGIRPGTDLFCVSTTVGTTIAICGVTGVGKSDIAWSLFSTLRGQGRTCAFLDLEQLGFSHGTSEPGLQASNVAAAWDAFAIAGATHLVLNGRVASVGQAQLYRAALPATAFHLVRLRAGRDDLARRSGARARGEGTRLAGDRLLGLASDRLAEVVDAAWLEQRRADTSQYADLTLDVDGRTAREVADVLSRRLVPPPPDEIDHTPSASHHREA